MGRWSDRLFTGHRTLMGRWGELTIYGANAMHWAVNLHVSGVPGWLCFHPTTYTNGGRWPWYVYFSRDATPGHVCFGFGPGFRHDGGDHHGVCP